jgi:hypothetical protein
MSDAKICTCQVITDLTGKPVSQARGKDCAVHPPPICTTCKDTHTMHRTSSSGDGDLVMCTSCPAPCEQCRSRGPGQMGGPYCAKTPCDCACHEKHHQYGRRLTNKGWICEGHGRWHHPNFDDDCTHTYTVAWSEQDNTRREPELMSYVTVDDVLAEIEKVNNLTLNFLQANREANEAEKLPPSGPASIAIWYALQAIIRRAGNIAPELLKGPTSPGPESYAANDESWDVRAHPTEKGVFYLEGPWRLSEKEVEEDRARVLQTPTKTEQKMIAIDLDENGNPKSAIPIDAHASAHINIFWDELVDAVQTKEPRTVVPTVLKKNIFLMAEKAYRMGIARDHGEHRKVKASYDAMAQLTGKLVRAMLDVKDALTVEDARAVAARVFELEPMGIEQINEQRASFAYGQLALTSAYHDASPEKLAELRATCRKMAGCKT